MKQEKSSVIHNLLTLLGAVLCVILTPILIVNCTLIVKSYLNKTEVPSFGTWVPMIVLTDSMYPAISSGDLILCRQVEPETVRVGDVICFFDPSSTGTTTVTHRVLEVVTEENSLSWVTKGDANNAQDSVDVPAANLVGLYVHRIPGAGNVAMFMQSTQGLIFCVVLPVLALLVYDMLRRKLYEKKKADDTQALLAELEALRAAQAKPREQDMDQY